MFYFALKTNLHNFHHFNIIHCFPLKLLAQWRSVVFGWTAMHLLTIMVFAYKCGIIHITEIPMMRSQLVQIHSVITLASFIILALMFWLLQLQSRTDLAGKCWLQFLVTYCMPKEDGKCIIWCSFHLANHDFIQNFAQLIIYKKDSNLSFYSIDVSSRLLDFCSQNEAILSNKKSCIPIITSLKITVETEILTCYIIRSLGAQ